MSTRKFTFQVMTLDEEEREPIIVRAENKAEAGGVAMSALRKNGQEPIIVYENIVVIQP